MSSQEQKKQPKKQFNEVDFDMSKYEIWSQDKINSFKRILAASYHGLLPSQISHKYEPIEDATDDDRRNCIYLVFYMEGEIALGGQTISSDSKRRVFRFKMPLTEELKQKAAARIAASPFISAPALRPIAMMPTKSQPEIVPEPAPQRQTIIRPRRIGPPTPN